MYSFKLSGKATKVTALTMWEMDPVNDPYMGERAKNLWTFLWHHFLLHYLFYKIFQLGQTTDIKLWNTFLINHSFRFRKCFSKILKLFGREKNK